MVDIKKEIERIGKKNGQNQKLIDGLEAKMKKKGYEENVPQEIKDENIAKLAGYKAEIIEMEKQAKKLAELE